MHRARRGGRLALTLVVSLVLGACRLAPLAPQSPADQTPRTPGRITEPVPSADSNPLDVPSIVETTCTPQGRPVVETDETRTCDEEPGCTVRCLSEPTPPQTSIDPANERCLALAMYWEAKAEGTLGMRAVGHVVLNRVAHDGFPDSPCDVMAEGGETPPCQFSWYCDGKSDHPAETANWSTAQGVASEIVAGRSTDPTGGALFFHATWMRSPWRVERTRTAEIGGHVFYR